MHIYVVHTLNKWAMEFKVFTLNCWGIPVVSKNRKARMRAIAEALASSPFDVVCLQEVWTNTDYNLIKGKLSGVFPYAHYFYSGVVGSGICILSRHPFQQVFYHQWSVNGYVHKFQHGDWFGGKGVGLCILKVNGFNINVYSAHLHAEYNRHNDEYQAHRVLQAYDTAQFIELTSTSADLVVLAGDLNTEPGDLAYRILLSMTNFTDSFEKIEELGESNFNTCEDLQNSYTPSSQIRKNIPGKRIDYIMFTSGQNIQAKVQSYHHPFPPRVPNSNFSYSDHEAITVSLCLKKIENGHINPDLNTKKDILTESIDVLDHALKSLKYHKHVYAFISAILFVILISTIALEPIYGFTIVFDVFRLILTCIFCFTLVMASLWNRIEKHAILAGKLAMEVHLGQLKTKQQF